MVTEHPARILRLPDYGLHVGAQAVLLLWDTDRPEEIIAALASPYLVIERGRVTVEHHHTVGESWRNAG